MVFEDALFSLFKFDILDVKLIFVKSMSENHCTLLDKSHYARIRRLSLHVMASYIVVIYWYTIHYIVIFESCFACQLSFFRIPLTNIFKGGTVVIFTSYVQI